MIKIILPVVVIYIILIIVAFYHCRLRTVSGSWITYDRFNWMYISDINEDIKMYTDSKDLSTLYFLNSKGKVVRYVYEPNSIDDGRYKDDFYTSFTHESVMDEVVIKDLRTANRYSEISEGKFLAYWKRNFIGTVDITIQNNKIIGIDIQYSNRSGFGSTF